MAKKGSVTAPLPKGHKTKIKLLGQPPFEVSVDGSAEFFDTVLSKYLSHYATLIEWVGQPPTDTVSTKD